MVISTFRLKQMSVSRYDIVICIVPDVLPHPIINLMGIVRRYEFVQGRSNVVICLYELLQRFSSDH